ncbi:DNA ligase, partial [Dissostichus eleginoides]
VVSRGQQRPSVCQQHSRFDILNIIYLQPALTPSRRNTQNNLRISQSAGRTAAAWTAWQRETLTVQNQIETAACDPSASHLPRISRAGDWLTGAFLMAMQSDAEMSDAAHTGGSHTADEGTARASCRAPGELEARGPLTASYRPSDRRAGTFRLKLGHNCICRECNGAKSRRLSRILSTPSCDTVGRIYVCPFRFAGEMQPRPIVSRL